MTKTGYIVQCCWRFSALLGMLIGVSACATFGPYPDSRGPDVQGSNSSAATTAEIPSYVRNLPKSKTGNMEQYTVFGKQYRVMETAENFREQGIASWYGKKFHGRKTSSGEIYDMYAMTAAHKHLPLPTFVRVVNLDNGKSIILKVNDRGPFVGDRVIDLSYAAAMEIGMAEAGTANVDVEALSTHHVAEAIPSKKIASEEAVAENAVSQIDEGAGENEGALIAGSSGVDATIVTAASGQAPVEIEAEVSAVPVSEPIPLNIDVEADGFIAETDEADGFVEQPGLAIGLSADGEQVVDASAQLAAAPDSPETPAFTDKANMVIQLGAFRQVDNANSLVSSVENQTGLPAYVERDSSNTLYRVKMGPFQRGERLQNTLIDLAEAGIEGFAVLSASN